MNNVVKKYKKINRLYNIFIIIFYILCFLSIICSIFPIFFPREIFVTIGLALISGIIGFSIDKNRWNKATKIVEEINNE